MPSPPVRVPRAVMVGRAVTRRLVGKEETEAVAVTRSEVKVVVVVMVATARLDREAMAETVRTVDRQLVAGAVTEETVGGGVLPPSVVLAVTVALVETPLAEMGEMVAMAE